MTKYSDENTYDYQISLKNPRDMTEEDAVNLQIELKEAKSKLRIISQKFTNLRKDRDSLKKDNKDLQGEIIQLQSSIREMVPGFSNTSSSFPMFNELLNQVSEFLKCDCEDIFFDILSPELNMDGIVYFFQNTLPRVEELIVTYFEPFTHMLKKTTCIDHLDGPLMNVLRKLYQNNSKKMFPIAVQNHALQNILHSVQNTLKLGNEEPATNKEILEFVRKMSEILFYSYISDPEFVFNFGIIGKRVEFNGLRHEALDGFVKNKEECVIILPSVHKHTINGEVLIKALVLSTNYDFP